MLTNLPILSYNELRPLMNLGHDHHSNGIVVDDASLEIMLRIEKNMQRLQVMGDDDRRYLWIRMKAPQKRNREDDTDKEGFNKAGIGVVSDSAERLMRIAEEKDMVSITPLPNKYVHDEEIGNEISLPYVCEEVTRKQQKELIKAIQWEPIEKVLPIEK